MCWRFMLTKCFGICLVVSAGNDDAFAVAAIILWSIYNCQSYIHWSVWNNSCRSRRLVKESDPICHWKVVNSSGLSKSVRQPAWLWKISSSKQTPNLSSPALSHVFSAVIIILQQLVSLMRFQSETSPWATLVFPATKRISFSYSRVIVATKDYIAIAAVSHLPCWHTKTCKYRAL